MLVNIAEENKEILKRHEKSIEQNKKDIKSIDERLVIVENKDGTREISYKEEYGGEK
jgi:ABC-type Fe3+-citrate transport system substrate-binding protein